MVALVTLTGFVDIWALVDQADEAEVEKILAVKDSDRTQAFLDNYELVGGRDGMMELARNELVG